MTATNDAVLITAPLPWRCMYGITCLQHRYTEVRLTSWTRRQASRPVSRIESSSGGEMPALLNATSTEPKASCAVRKAAATSVSDVTSACTYRPPVSAAAFSPAASSMSTATTCAPSAANRRAAASPIPLPAPVMTTVLPSNRCTFSPEPCLFIRCDKHVLDFGECVGGVRAELTAEAGLLEAAERRPVAHRGM